MSATCVFQEFVPFFFLLCFDTSTCFAFFLLLYIPVHDLLMIFAIVMCYCHKGIAQCMSGYRYGL